MEISDKVKNLTPSVTQELNTRVAQMIKEGEDIIKFNIGEPDFHTPENIKEAAIKAINENFTRYTPAPGIPELRKAIKAKFSRDNGLDYELDEIQVTTGAKQALTNALMTTVNDGDEILLPTPCWVSYEELIKIAGGKPVLVSIKPDFQLDIDGLEKAVTEKTKAILINTPNNPTGAVYSKESLIVLADFAKKHDIYIISDEVYEKLVYTGAEHVSIASLSEDAKNRTITINGVSKTYAMTGWRIGYMAGPKTLIKGAKGLEGHMTSAPNSIAQKAAAEAISGPQDSVEEMRKEFEKRGAALATALNEITGISCPIAEGAFYLLPDVSYYFGKKDGDTCIRTSSDLAAFLLKEAKIAVVPGDAFRAPNCIRMSYANSLDSLLEGANRMRKALKQLL